MHMSGLFSALTKPAASSIFRWFPATAGLMPVPQPLEDLEGAVPHVHALLPKSES